MDHNSPEFRKAMEEQIQSLPLVIRNLIVSDEWKRWVGNIAKKNSLNLDQASSLEPEVFVFLVGLSDIYELRKSVQDELNIPASKVNDIMIDINEMIVDPLKKKLIEATSGDEEAIAKAPIGIATSVSIHKKEEEIIDRQKVLAAIEEHDHAPGVGVYMPPQKKVQPIAQNTQINSRVTPVPQNFGKVQPSPSIPTAKPSPTASPIQIVKPTSIFEAKTSAVVAPAPQKATVIVPEKPASSGDPYREVV